MRIIDHDRKRLAKTWRASWNPGMSRLFAAVCAAGLMCGLNLPAEDLPAVQVTNIRRVFHNGEHNAFTDLVRFQGRYYLTFRSCPDGHMVFPTSAIIVMVSDDFRQWRQVHRFSVARRDTRDPHFLVFKEKLFVYTGTWYCGDGPPALSEYDLNRHLGYGVWTADGKEWSPPQLLEGTFGHYIWRANSFGGRAYLCGRRKRDFVFTEGRSSRDLIESAMLESDDGLVWKTRSLFQETRGDETAFQFEADGRILAVARRGGGAAQLCRSTPPYDAWEREDLDRYIGGPLLTRWNGRYVVGGRQSVKGEGAKTSLYWLAGDQLHEFARLPSGGDNSYPGFLELDARHAVVSWYSSHERDADGKTITAIYMADLEINE